MIREKNSHSADFAEGKKMKITILGAGAIGGICGAYLIREGVCVDGVRGELTTPLNAVVAEELTGPLGLVLLAVKSTKTLEALENIRPLLEPDTTIVSLQNGINEDRIASAIGPERVVGCSIGWGATYAGPGRLSQTSEGKFIIGELNGAMTDRIKSVKNILDDISETALTSNIYGHLWTKLAMNCVIGGCAVLGLTVGETLESERNKRLFIKLIREVIRTAEACGVTMEKYEGVVDPYVFKRSDEEGIELCFQLLDMVGATHGRVKPGPLQDIEKGIKTEVDHITGYCVDMAREKNVAAPINTTALEIIKEIETGQATPSPENLSALEAAADG